MSTDIELSAAKRQLLQRMMSGAAPGRVGKTDGVVPRPPGATVPISLDQSHLWLHAEMAGEVPIYNESVTIYRKGPFDLAVLEKGFNEILRRHEIWRTSFEVVGDDIVQGVHPELAVRLVLDDLTRLPASQREGEALALATADARRPIDPTKAPLFRARVVKLSEQEHRLYLALHHIVFDGVSLSRVFLPELATLYDAFSRGEASPLPEPALQYGDYAIWREEEARSAHIERQMAYWHEALGGPLPKLELVGDRPRPPLPSHRGAMETFMLAPDLLKALKGLSRSEGATLYMTLLAAFKVMLFRYTGQKDLLIGGVTDLRRRPELERLMGYFLNSMALRTRPSGDLAFRDYLAQVRASVLGALDASEAPFDRVVRELGVTREPSAHPIFQAVFSMQPLVEPFPAGWDLTQMDVEVGGTKFDLYLELEERPDGMAGRFIYARDLFEAATIRRMIDHWRTILEGVVADPDAPLGRLPILSPQEERTLLVDWNATDAPIPAATMHAWFAAQARLGPERIAAEFEDEAWTYRELDRRSDIVAVRLQEAGVAPGALVGTCMNRSLGMLAGVLGILKAGAGYLPLDPGFPQARLDYIVANAQPTALLIETGLLTRLDLAHLPIVLADAEGDDEPAPTVTAADGEDLAYVVYTSGSTGQPKGAEITHVALVNLLAAMQRELSFTPEDSMIALATLAFDLAAFELLLPLVCGGRVIIASREVAADPTALAEQVRRSGCSVMAATPATWRALIDSGWPGREALRILCGGEPMPRSLADDLLRRCDALWNVYGPTETTIFSTVHRVLPGADTPPIGRPIANLKHYILDPAGNPAPTGAVGELYIGGVGLARGYRNRPDLTQERFVERAVAGSQRLYRTGDLARYRGDGIVECHGRIDSEEKIRGFRVAVEEIEAALARHPDIGSAAVRAWPDASGNRALSAYFVVRDGQEPAVADLRRHLGQTLPDYMIPARFVRIDALPMTPTGKVDRKALPEPADNALRSEFTPPKGQAEERLAAIWREVLEVAAVGRNENFFDLGGHSLLAAKLLRRIELEYGRRLTMAGFFQAPTLEAMARLLADEGSREPPKTIAIQPSGSRPPLLWLDASPAFRALANAIGRDQPFLGVSVEPALELAEGSAMRLQDVAARVAVAVREAQPRGPYYLGGWCNMGVLAYEVASQLSARGQAVELVLLLDATNPASYRQISRAAFLSSQFRYHWPRFWAQRGWARWRYFGVRIQSLLRTLGALPAPTADRQALLRAHFARLVWRYHPPAYAGDVALFQPLLRLDVLNFRPGWAERVAGRLDAYEVPGCHVTMLAEPHVQELGAAMRGVLLQAQERARARAGA